MRPAGEVGHGGDGASMGPVPARGSRRKHNFSRMCRTLQFIRLSHDFLKPFSPLCPFYR